MLTWKDHLKNAAIGVAWGLALAVGCGLLGWTIASVVGPLLPAPAPGPVPPQAVNTTIDPETGCHYFVFGQTVTPRLLPTGLPYCRKDRP